MDQYLACYAPLACRICRSLRTRQEYLLNKNNVLRAIHTRLPVSSEGRGQRFESSQVRQRPFVKKPTSLRIECRAVVARVAWLETSACACCRAAVDAQERDGSFVATLLTMSGYKAIFSSLRTWLRPKETMARFIFAQFIRLAYDAMYRQWPSCISLERCRDCR